MPSSKLLLAGLKPFVEGASDRVDHGQRCNEERSHSDKTYHVRLGLSVVLAEGGSTRGVARGSSEVTGQSLGSHCMKEMWVWEERCKDVNTGFESG